MSDTRDMDEADREQDERDREFDTDPQVIRQGRITNVSIVPEGEGFPGSHIELVNEELPPAPPLHAHMDEH